jgi:hypothetical protein
MAYADAISGEKRVKARLHYVLTIVKQLAERNMWTV